MRARQRSAAGAGATPTGGAVTASRAGFGLCTGRRAAHGEAASRGPLRERAPQVSGSGAEWRAGAGDDAHRGSRAEAEGCADWRGRCEGWLRAGGALGGRAENRGPSKRRRRLLAEGGRLLLRLLAEYAWGSSHLRAAKEVGYGARSLPTGLPKGRRGGWALWRSPSKERAATTASRLPERGRRTSSARAAAKGDPRTRRCTEGRCASFASKRLRTGLREGRAGALLVPMSRAVGCRHAEGGDGGIGLLAKGCRAAGGLAETGVLSVWGHAEG